METANSSYTSGALEGPTRHCFCEGDMSKGLELIYNLSYEYSGV